MKCIESRKKLVTGMLVWLMAMPVVPMAQTRNRPPLRNNNTSSYRYAYEHGYRAGYEDGFAQGQDDFKANERRDFARSDAYRSADRTYESGMGALNEYKDAYRIGFEVAYNDGYYGRPYSTSMPTNLGQIVSGAETAATRPRSRDEVQTNSSRGDVYVPDGVELKVRLTSPISTKTNREGDTFTVTVLDPSEYADATITGHIAKINRSGKASGKTEMALAFDAITLRDRRNGSFAGQVERVYASESVKTVDEEGNVETASRGKDTAVRGVGGGALGAIIGGIAGGGKGAAIGAIIGAGVGAGSVFVQGGKDLMLDPGTEMLIRSNGRGRSR